MKVAGSRMRWAGKEWVKTDCQKEHGKQKRVAEDEEDQSCDGKIVSNEIWKEQVRTAENINNESRRSKQVTWTLPRKGTRGRNLTH